MSFLSSLNRPIESVATFQDLPSAVVNAGAFFTVSNIGLHGNTVFYSDGVYWRPTNGSCILASVAGSPISPIATQSADSLGTFTFITPDPVIIPRGLVTPGSSIEIKARLQGLGVSGAGASCDVYFSDGVIDNAIFLSTRIIGNSSNSAYDCFYRTNFPNENTAVGGFFRDWFFVRTETTTYANVFTVPFNSQDIEVLFKLLVSTASAGALYGLTSYTVTFKG